MSTTRTATMATMQSPFRSKRPHVNPQRVSFKRAPSGFRATAAPKSDTLLDFDVGRKCGHDEPGAISGV